MSVQKPEKTRIFLDSGDPEETKGVLQTLGFLDGQTTNPSLIAKSPEAEAKRKAGDCFTDEELRAFYKKVVQEVSGLIPNGSVSIETYADMQTTAQEMLQQAEEMERWIPNAHIKFPTTPEGLKAAAAYAQGGGKVNMTLVFSQAQAAAVYAATKGARKGSVFLSPFLGRLDDIGQRGCDLVANIQKMYASGDGHVEVLAASIRGTAHLYAVLERGVDIVTVPADVLFAWAEGRAPEAAPDLEPIPYEEHDINADWQSFDLSHELTTQGLEKFVKDWDDLINCVKR